MPIHPRTQHKQSRGDTLWSFRDAGVVTRQATSLLDQVECRCQQTAPIICHAMHPERKAEQRTCIASGHPELSTIGTQGDDIRYPVIFTRERARARKARQGKSQQRGKGVPPRKNALADILSPFPTTRCRRRPLVMHDLVPPTVAAVSTQPQPLGT